MIAYRFRGILSSKLPNFRLVIMELSNCQNLGEWKLSEAVGRCDIEV